jgi:hypothetical protein
VTNLVRAVVFHTNYTFHNPIFSFVVHHIHHHHLHALSPIRLLHHISFLLLASDICQPIHSTITQTYRHGQTDEPRSRPLLKVIKRSGKDRYNGNVHDRRGRFGQESWNHSYYLPIMMLIVDLLCHITCHHYLHVEDEM